MKKTLLILTLLFSVVAGAMAQNDAMYVYRNDGEFNAFLKSDVDSMRYSHLDADSVFHDDWQMQEFFTADSVYRIPLAAIDSVSFVTPSMEYKSDVKLVEDNLLKYLIAHTDKTLTFSLNVPTGLLPSVGDVVVYDKYEEPIPEGFYGRYVSRKSTSDGIECLFEEVGLEEIYNHLVVVGQVGSYNEDDNENSQRRIFTVGNNKRVCLPLKVPLSVSIKDIVHGVDIFGSNAKRAVDINGSIGITLDRPQLTINYIICIGERNLKNQVMLKARFYSEGEASVSGNLAGNYSPEPMWFPGCQWPFNFYGIAGEFDLGLYFEANGEINASYSVPIVIDVTRGFSIKEGEWPYFYEGNGSCANRDKAEWDLNLNGSLSAGLAGRLSVGLVNKKVASLDVTLKAGPEVSANFKIADKESGFNSNLYDALKNTEVTASLLRLQADAGYRIWFKDRESFDHPLNVHLFKTTRPILPTIENVKWTPSGLCSGTLTADVSRDTFTRVSLGWTLRDKNDEVYMKEFYDEKYQFNENWPYVNLPLNLSDLPANYNYKAYPTVKLWKWEIPINEYAEVVSKGCPAHITDFKVTKSYHKDGAYTNDGRSYDYKFDAATTVELDPEIVRDLNGDGRISAADLSGIDDWGYAYEDPNGKTTHISLKNFSSPYTDTRYAYYRNDPSSSVRLYGYVRYSGDGEYYYDEPQDFPLEHKEELHLCPDDHHPHMIDLGLPSGTKWACCNVGANSPEEHGGYYAWGETSEKSYYDWSTYKWCNGSENTMTKYCTESDYGTVDGKTELDPEDDAAYVNWGAEWRMPSKVQVVELCDTYNCTWEWITLNGMEGLLITSRNNTNSLFLPAAGFSINDSYEQENNDNYYWTRSLDCSGAYALHFASRNDYASWDDYKRNKGFSVRPVENKPASARITDFEVTDSSYEKGGYSNDDETYDYKFEVATTVTLDEDVDMTNIEDWGYACEEPEGNITHISLKDYESPYTHNAVYYRNTESSTVRLYGYTLYKGSDEYWYDEPQEFPLEYKKKEHNCPDDHHPHLIDLGLPSGTKWACCNVGANSPEECGGYYAWGETSEKDSYDWSTYKYCKGTYMSMTKYCTDSRLGIVDGKTELDPEDDAAYVNWGAGWRMPSDAQLTELCTNCTWTWDSTKKGYTFVGPNKSSLFLPAAGSRDNDYPDSAGSYGNYWSRSLFTGRTSGSDCAYSLHFNTGAIGFLDYSRYSGFSVRPVRVSASE